MHRTFVWTSIAVFALHVHAYGEDLIHDARRPTRIDARDVAAAIGGGRAILERAVENYPKHRDCFSCHHHTLPLLAMREMRSAAIDGDDKLIAGAADFTQNFFAARVDKLREGRGIGGQAATVSYGLWALDIADAKPDDTTAAMVDFLLKTQRDDGRWVPQSNRPPLEESHIATTVLSAYYMPRLCADKQHNDVEQSVARARHWLASAARESQEDRVFALWGSVLLEDAREAPTAERQLELRDELLAAQRDDGGWSQLVNMESDAYATGQTLFVLHQAGLPVTSVFFERGVEFLLKSQHDDGSWLVETRSRPVQVFFDNGDPHGKSQFISIAATSWAVAALAAVSEPSPDISFDFRDDRVAIRARDDEVGTYVFNDEKISRPYFAHLKTLGGAQVTRNHPPRDGDAADHAEFHPGLWLAFGDISGADSWRLAAKVEHVGFVKELGGEYHRRGFAVLNRYFAADGKQVICEETARYEFHIRPQGLLLTCDSTFSSADADFAFGDQEEMGLGVRLHTPLAVASGKGGRILDAAGNTNEKHVWGKSSPWCDYASPLDERFVGVTLMAHPKNFRPPWWHVRDYGLAVANPFGQNALARGERSSVVVKGGEVFRLRFGVLLHEHASEKQFDPAAGYDDYLTLSADRD